MAQSNCCRRERRDVAFVDSKVVALIACGNDARVGEIGEKTVLGKPIGGRFISLSLSGEMKFVLKASNREANSIICTGIASL